ncbi:hypothetical protein NL676_032809 [Syzygium grande]|nr:hypothetical protein NL676_032809 [Syzygium grande]
MSTHRREKKVPVKEQQNELWASLEAGIESEVGDRSVLEQDRISEDIEASLTARVLEICEQLEKSGGLGDDEEETLPESSSRINLGSWDVALSNDDDEETLLHTIYESDVDDEDLALAREEVRAYQQGRKVSIGVVDEGTSVNQDGGAPTADRDDTEYEQSAWETFRGADISRRSKSRIGCTTKNNKKSWPSTAKPINGNSSTIQEEATNGTTKSEEFLELAKVVWLLHLLAFSLDTATSLFEASRGAELHPQFMESVVKFLGGGQVPASHVVGFPVSPGFKLGNGVDSLYEDWAAVVHTQQSSGTTLHPPAYPIRE